MIFAVEQEKGNFKGRVFGGFNRHDVIDYIESLAGERNELMKENQRLRGRIEALEDRLSDTPEDNGARDIAARALCEARKAIDDARAEYDGIYKDVNINASQASHELETVTAKLAALQSALKTAGERLEAVSGTLAAEPEE